MTIYLLRASHSNIYELQNYIPLLSTHDIKVISSKNPLTDAKIPTIKLFSPTDLPSFPYRRQLLNRLIGGEQWLFGLGSLVRSDDIIHTAETYTPYTHQAVQLRKNNRIKRLVCTCWETIPFNNEKFPRLRSWKKDAYQYVDIFHTPTQRAKQALIKEGVEASRIKVVPYGVDLSRFKHNLLPKSIDRKLRVLTVARPVKEKGYQLYPQIISKLGSIAEFHWINGRGYDQMPNIYNNADIFFFPSQATDTWEEQYGMVLVEAMAAGLPIVTTSSGAIPEVVGNATLINAPADVAGLCETLKQLISSNSLRHKLSRLAVARSKIYSHHTSSKLLAALYTTSNG